MTIHDQMQAGKRGPRKQHVDFAAKFTSNEEAHGMDLGPALKKWRCRKCLREVPSDCATCPKCREAQK